MVIREFLEIIPESEIQCLIHLKQHLVERQPLKGIRILLNTHITLATVALLDGLLAIGATVVLTSAPALVQHEKILKKLELIMDYVEFSEILKYHQADMFDLALDCGGYLVDLIQPKLGLVELTHVSDSIYKNTRCPVISIDQSQIKHIETILGTGSGFGSAVKKLLLEKNEEMIQQSYVIFGFGKVGRGIAYTLTKAGISKSSIYIVELSEIKIKQIEHLGFNAFDIEKHFKQIQLILKTADWAITATGIQGAITHYFDSSDFNAVKYLANMGTYDEWGEAFTKRSILNAKKPFNFMLNVPTRLIYLDPIFSTMIYTCVDLVESLVKATDSVMGVKVSIQQKVLNDWMQNNPHFDSFEALQLEIEEVSCLLA